MSFTMASLDKRSFHHYSSVSSVFSVFYYFNRTGRKYPKISFQKDGRECVPYCYPPPKKRLKCLHTPFASVS